MGPTGEDAALQEGRQCSLWLQRVVWESEMCRVCTEPSRVVLKHAPRNGAGVSRQ